MGDARKVSLRRTPVTRRSRRVAWLRREIPWSRVGLQVPWRSLEPQGAAFWPWSNGKVPGKTHRLEARLGAMPVRGRKGLTTSS